MDIVDADLVIVGAGIAGPALAARLRDTGWRIILIERSTQGADTARGDHLQARVIAALDEWGALSAVKAAGAEVREGVIYSTPEGEEVFNGSIVDLDIPHPYFLFLNHEKIAETLLSVAAENPNFTLMCPASVRDVKQNQDGSASIEVSENGETIQIRANAIAGADGRGSVVRRKLGISAEVHDYNTPLALTFAPNPNPGPNKFIISYLCGPTSVAVIPRTGGNLKIGVPVEPGEIGFWKAATSTDITSRLAALVPSLKNLNPEPMQFYPVQRVTAGDWTKGNAILLGDACFAMHPARSQGMNIAIRAVDALGKHLDRIGRPEPDAFAACFATFEAEFRPALQPILDKNHQYGLAMDAMDAGVLSAFADRLRAINSDPDLKHQMVMEQAGYSGP